MGSYFLNRETRKLELHFEKSEYQALPESMKSEIKSSFLWSSKQGAWVSRTVNNHWMAERVAKKLNLENSGMIGERLTYAEELERKSEKAEARAERYETYSDNAQKRAETLQADFNKYRKDWSWLTQPIISGHAGSRAFANHKNKVMARYDRGFDEYKKSEYYQDRAATARATADNKKLGDKVYLHNRIKECNKNIKAYQGHISKCEEALCQIQQGKTFKRYDGTIVTEESQEELIEKYLDRYEYEQDKIEFFENCMENLGGCNFSKENVKKGFIVKIKTFGDCEVVSTGAVNITFKILTGGASGHCGKCPYEAILEISGVKLADKVENPYEIGDILTKSNISGSQILSAYQVVKVTDSGVKIQNIAISNNVPQLGQFTSSKQQLKKIVKSKFSDFVGIYIDQWQLHKYNAAN
jgi:hypothetical protein